MGQQQLLLIVLGVIIVGVAIVAGIGLFNAGAEESTKDELVSHGMAIAANAQQFYKKPIAMGGGGNSFNSTGHVYAIPTKMISTANGTYSVAVTDSTAIITGIPNSRLGYGWRVTATVTPTNISTVVQ